MSKNPTALTMSVPEAGRIVGIARNAAYEAARRGEIPVIRFGGRLRVPIIALERMLADATPRTSKGGGEGPKSQ